MGVSFGNHFSVVCLNEESATVVKKWVEKQGDERYGVRLPEAYCYDTPVYALEQFGNTVYFRSEGYGTYDTVAFTPVNEHIDYFVSMVDSRQCQDTNYVSTIVHYDIWEAHSDDPERTPGYHRNDPGSLAEDHDYCDWYDEPEWDDDNEEESQRQSDKLWNEMLTTFADYSHLPNEWLQSRLIQEN